MTTAAVATTTTETAYAWWQRARAQQPMLAPTHPAAAARAFGQQLATGGWGGDRPTTTTSSSRRRRRVTGQPLVEVTGPVVATTATLVTLAVRYVVQTRPSLFADAGQQSSTSAAAMLPQVFLMDASWEISMSQIRRILRATLLRDYDAAAVDGAASPPPPPDDHDVRLARDTECCLSRIHMAHADAVDTLPLVASSLATHVATHSRSHPTLVLWNTTAGEDEDDPQEPAARREVQRQFLRLADQYEFLLVVAAATFSGPSSSWPPPQATRPKGVWDDRVTQRIRLAAAPPGAVHAYTAQTSGSSGETPAVLSVSLTAVGVRFG
jgi:hypothetical protein